MTFSNSQSLEQRGIDWLAIVRITMAQVAILVALAAAVVGYVNWSSEVAWKEFTAAGNPQASMPVQQHSQSSSPVQRVRDEALRIRRV